ncbi:hypothetical protein ASPSYDRAFT_29412 [Aspergillus sydowii CBS 593.65]|uniref:Uncharacterized protein n=1 Tax=Aspergillus sydowii CBS 593.65 TaxID=1036612 RepID=A0A1L9TNB1_9EURO|nr:uncharacterized protein ASPSYDRAFT_29412 [Aspergillus sydowii CBS 593.65]OJJ60892.1 hypothetical protein ASPSYDRAFT_29412 [Aspergillus sydowii CBS 593.65]
MSTPERKSGQTSWARRQQQQQHNSPFRRARRDSLHLDASHGLSPPHDSPARHRRNFSRTGTLRGAFEYTSRLPLSEIEEDLFLPQNAQRGSPRKRQRSVTAMSSRSNPPELDEAYRQIDDALSLTDNDLSDDENALYINKDNKFRRSVGTPTTKKEQRVSTASDASFTSESPHRRFTDYARDEERLKRATTGRSPVFNKAAIGVGPSSEHLQRREVGSPSASEEDYGIEPPVKAPSTWGSRGKYGNNWIKSLTRNYDREADMTTEESEESSARLWDNTRNHERRAELTREEPEEGSARLWNKIDSRRAERETAERQQAVEERPGIPRYGHRSPSQVQDSPQRGDDFQQGGQRIPNTPISIFPGSTFTKRSPAKRDSHDLLRKLARTGSPNQKATDSLQTPQQPAVATERRVYDKTPVVTGAWIDTPMSQRVPESQTTNVINALGSKLDSVWGSTRPVKTEDCKEDADNLLPNFEPMKEKEVVEDPPSEQPKESPIEAHGETKPTEEIFRRRAQASKVIQKPMKLSLPEHAKSALETVLDDHKNNKNPLDAGDDTIESLQAILDQQPSEDTKTQEEDDAAYEEQILGSFRSRASSEQPSSDDNEIPKEDDAAYQQPVAQQFKSKAPAEQEAAGDTKPQEGVASEKRAIRPFKSKSFSDSKDPSDIKASERLGRKLRSLSESFSYVKSGFNKLENQITHHNDSYTASLNKTSAKTTGSKPAQPQKGCECKTNGDMRGVIALPRLWDRGSVWWRTRPTRLGWCILIALGWYFSESTMCDYYCHPLVESTCEGNCLLPDAPRFPYVIPTMAWRWLHLSDILIPLWAIIIAFFRLFTQVLGLSDGYVDDEPLALNLTGKIRIEGTMMDSFAPMATPSSKNFIPSVAHWARGQATQNPDPTIDLPTVMSSDSNTFNWDDVSMDEDEFL